jgi:hypothetical protein
MIGYLRFRWGLWRAQKRLRWASKAYVDDIRGARAKQSGWQEIEKIKGMQVAEEELIQEEIRSLQTRRLLSAAQKLLVPYPDEGWVEGKTVNRYLTVTGMNDFRARIRAEKKARWELVVMWMPAVAGITGLVGAVTGLVAVLWKTAGH